jgi:hypothetical protein
MRGVENQKTSKSQKQFGILQTPSPSLYASCVEQGHWSPKGGNVDALAGSENEQ